MICIGWQRKENNMVTEKENNAITISIRYCFNEENLHSMNAEIFNECEKQFIKAIKSTEKYLENFLTINIKPREEGSLRDIIEVVTTNPAFNNILGSLISFLFTRFAPAVSQSQKTANIIDIVSKNKNNQIKSAHIEKRIYI
jgi:hypothetical protein